MTAAFLTLGLGIGALGLAIGSTGGDGWRARVVTVALLGSGVSVIVAGLYRTEPGAATTAEIVHSRASAGATLVLIGVALLWSFQPRSGRPLRALAIAAALLGVLSAALHETSATGLSQRLLWFTLLGWLLLASFSLDPEPEQAVVDAVARGS